MSSYVGPNGRLYRRKSHYGRWVALTIVAILAISAVLVGLPNITAPFRYAGL
jgi:hypothetical protein